MKYWITRADDAQKIIKPSGEETSFTLISEKDTREEATAYVELNYPNVSVWNATDKITVYIDNPFTTKEIIVIEELPL